MFVWIIALVACDSRQAIGEDPRGPCDPKQHAAKRKKMVQEQIRARGVEDRTVLEALEKVPRHCFVPPTYVDEAYDDHPLPIGLGQTISQPYIVALMTELLRLKASDRVLEVGTGSGYQSAVLATLVKEVYTVEIYPALAREAAVRLRSLEYPNLVVRHGDGYFGWEAHAPYDAIMVTAASSEIPPPLLRQLKPGGRMCIPVGGIYQVQQLTLVAKDSQGSIKTRGMLPVRFVPLLGDH
jgi:protein-L-isoaspartate(D-aspartate) O-methyltransferase